MVIAYHLVFTSYGFWLPNDPRGSYSEFVRSWELFCAAGPATRVRTDRSVARDPHDWEARVKGKGAMGYAAVVFSEEQMACVGWGIGRAVERSGYVVHACSVMPTHVHAVVKRHHYAIEQVMNQMKGEAAKALVQEGMHPFQEVYLPRGKRHSAWTEEGWDVYLNDGEDIRRAIEYVRGNPVKEGRKAQAWGFEVAYG